MIKLQLNIRKPNNYAFFCPTSRLHLTYSDPVGVVDRVTPAILIGLKSGKLIDVDGVVNLEDGTVANVKETVAPLEEVGNTKITQEVELKEKEIPETDVSKESDKEEPKNKRKSKKASETTEE